MDTTAIPMDVDEPHDESNVMQDNVRSRLLADVTSNHSLLPQNHDANLVELSRLATINLKNMMALCMTLCEGLDKYMTKISDEERIAFVQATSSSTSVLCRLVTSYVTVLDLMRRSAIGQRCNGPMIMALRFAALQNQAADLAVSLLPRLVASRKAMAERHRTTSYESCMKPYSRQFIHRSSSDETRRNEAFHHARNNRMRKVVGNIKASNNAREVQMLEDELAAFTRTGPRYNNDPEHMYNMQRDITKREPNTDLDKFLDAMGHGAAKRSSNNAKSVLQADRAKSKSYRSRENHRPFQPHYTVHYAKTNSLRPKIKTSHSQRSPRYNTTPAYRVSCVNDSQNPEKVFSKLCSEIFPESEMPSLTTLQVMAAHHASQNSIACSEYNGAIHMLGSMLHRCLFLHCTAESICIVLERLKSITFPDGDTAGNGPTKPKYRNDPSRVNPGGFGSLDTKGNSKRTRSPVSKNKQIAQTARSLLRDMKNIASGQYEEHVVLLGTLKKAKQRYQETQSAPDLEQLLASAEYHLTNAVAKKNSAVARVYSKANHPHILSCTNESGIFKGSDNPYIRRDPTMPVACNSVKHGSDSSKP